MRLQKKLNDHLPKLNHISAKREAAFLLISLYNIVALCRLEAGNVSNCIGGDDVTAPKVLNQSLRVAWMGDISRSESSIDDSCSRRVAANNLVK